MKPNLFLFAMLFMGTIFTSCKKSDIIHQSDFEKSYKEWQSFKTSSANSYKYTVGSGSWVGVGWQTDITVSEGKVVQRHFKLSFPAGWTGTMPDADKLEWTENAADINTHVNTAAADAVTLDQVYENARNNWLKKRDNAENYFEAKNNGLISMCGYGMNGCQDDCFQGIIITDIESL